MICIKQYACSIPGSSHRSLHISTLALAPYHHPVHNARAHFNGIHACPCPCKPQGRPHLGRDQRAEAATAQILLRHHQQMLLSLTVGAANEGWVCATPEALPWSSADSYVELVDRVCCRRHGCSCVVWES